MDEINDKNHITIVIPSLSKIYNNSRMTGLLDSTNLYVLEAINKLLNCCLSTITHKEHQQLTSLYYKVLTTSKNICLPIILPKYRLAPVQKTFVQAEFVDCNTYPKYEDIYYWQEEDYTITNADIVEDSKLTGFTTGKLKDTRINFAIGKTIDYIFIGRIGFFILDTQSTDVFKIYDEFDNDVTTGFTVTFIDENNSILLTSNNIYSYGEMKFKIKKI